MGLLSRLLKEIDHFYQRKWSAQENYGTNDDRFWLPYRAWLAVLALRHLVDSDRRAR